MRIAQAIGIEALVGLSFAAGEAHITFSLDSGRHYRARLFQLFHPIKMRFKSTRRHLGGFK